MSPSRFAAVPRPLRRRTGALTSPRAFPGACDTLGNPQAMSKTTSRAPEPPPKIGYGDHLLRERRGLAVDAQDLTMVQRQELRQNISTAILGVVRARVAVGTSCRPCAVQGERQNPWVQEDAVQSLPTPPTPPTGTKNLTPAAHPLAPGPTVGPLKHSSLTSSNF